MILIYDLDDRKGVGLMYKHTKEVHENVQIDTFVFELKISDEAKIDLDYWMVEGFDDYEFDLAEGVIKARKELVHYLV